MLVAGKQDVVIAGLEPVGHDAIRILFDDGHETGIDSWATLLTLGQEQESRWQAYLAALAAKGLSRAARPARPAPH